MIVKNQYKYILTDRFGTIDVAPLGEGDFKVSYEQDSDGKYFYDREFQGKMTFMGEIYKRLKRIEQSIYICSKQRLQVVRLCGTSEQVVFDGVFSLPDGSWDDDKCLLILKFEKSKIDKCLNDNKTVKLNLLLEIPNKITVKAGTPGGVLEYKECVLTQTYCDETIGGAVWCNDAGSSFDLTEAYENNWEYYYNRVIDDKSFNPCPDPSDGGTIKITSKWVREVITVACGTSVPPEWIPIGTCVSGEQKYAKKAALYNCTFRENNDEIRRVFETTYQCDILGASTGQLTEIDNGVLLSDVLKLMVSRFCGASVVSDFFQINPVITSDINYVTGQTSQVKSLVLFQKSDVKRPNDLNNATSALWTFEKLIQALKIMFNTYYFLENGVFRIEHISWFSRAQGRDLTLPKYAKYVKGLNQYTYDLENVPQSEKWLFKEQSTFGDWGTSEIDYNTTCAVAGNKDNNQIFTIEDLTTDVELCLSNSASDNNTVSDSGFVMIATTVYDGKYYIITENDGRVNNSLSWIRLIPRYNFYYRPVSSGEFNGNDVTFFSTKPFKKGAKISIPIECGETFNPNESIKTGLGVGVIDKATFNMQSCMMDLELKYNVFDELINNEPPVITPGPLQTYKDVPILFDIVSSDPDGVIVEIKVKNQALNGVVEILSLTQAKYTPNANYVGFDYFTLVATDNWSEVSNDAAYPVDVLNTNQPPIAVDDFYIVYHGEAFTSDPGILANDSDDVGFTLITTTVITTQGITVNIDPITGVFNYTPVSGFEGDDLFNYTIEDNTGLQSSATVTLNVRFKNKPIAVDDHYNSIMNTAFVADGTIGKDKLWQNDYTPDGLTYTYNCTAETKPTLHGGNVTINTDGTFIYNPALGFTGIDSFGYTVNNINGSDHGTAFMHVAPMIYVQLIKNDLKFTPYAIDCEGMPTLAGGRRTQDITLKFWADSGKTVPFDVSGYGFKVNIRENITTQFGSGPPSTTNDDWVTGVLSGIEFKLIDDFEYEEEVLDCNNDLVSKRLDDLIILPGNYTIVT